MTISGVSGSSSLAGLDTTDQDSKMKKVKTDFDALAAALKSGDLTAAKTAYAQVQQDMKNAPQPPQNSQSSSSGSSQTSPADALKAIGDALNSGDIAAAQKAFSTLQSQGGQRPHHHHHSQSAISTTDTTSTDSTQSTTGIDITA
jgi:DNA-binding FadR family transcriptional regulator